MMSNALCALTSALLGLLVAPYLHWLIARTPMHLPLRGVPIHCSNCGTRVSRNQSNSLWARIRNRSLCTTCGSSLWPDSPWVELGTAAIFALVGWRLDWAWALPAYWVFFFAVIAIVLVDLRHYLIPTRIVYPAVGIGIVLLTIAAVIGGDFDHLGSALLAMIVCWLFYFVCWFVFPAGMGFGDVRLALLIGLFTGWIALSNALLALLLGLLLGAGIGLLLVAARLRSRKDAIPFAPFMVLGASIAILFGSLFGNAG